VRPRRAGATHPGQGWPVIATDGKGRGTAIVSKAVSYRSLGTCFPGGDAREGDTAGCTVASKEAGSPRDRAAGLFDFLSQRNLPGGTKEGGPATCGMEGRPAWRG